MACIRFVLCQSVALAASTSGNRRPERQDDGRKRSGEYSSMLSGAEFALHHLGHAMRALTNA